MDLTQGDVSGHTLTWPIDPVGASGQLIEMRSWSWSRRRSCGQAHSLPAGNAELSWRRLIDPQEPQWLL